MISNKEGLHYFTVQKLSALLRGLTSKHDKDFYCLNCLFSCRTKKKSLNHINYVEMKIFVILQCLVKKIAC